MKPEAPQVTLTSILERQIADKGRGKDAKAVGESFIKKARLIISEFDAFRQDTDVISITPEVVGRRKGHMQSVGTLSNTTIRQRLQNLATLLQYGIKQSYGTLFPNGNPAVSTTVERPGAVIIPNIERTYKL